MPKFNIFGYSLQKTPEETNQAENASFAPPPNEEGTMDYETTADGFNYGIGLTIGAEKTVDEANIIQRYRQMVIHAEVDDAIASICQEAIVHEDSKSPVSLDISDEVFDKEVVKKIQAEFDTVCDLLDFNSVGHKLFRKWYIDSKLAYHIIIDKNKPEDGIKELRRLEPKRLKKVRKLEKKTDPNTKIETIEKVTEFFIYDQRTDTRHDDKMPVVSNMSAFAKIGIPKDAIIYVTSGLVDPKTSVTVGHLHKAIRPLNQLKMMEDALVIYRLSRAPERRVFYIDVGSLPKGKAEQYIRNLATKYKNKLVYDSTTGAIRNDSKHMHMLEDFWLPRREGGKGTEVTTLAGGQNLSQIEDIEFFQKKLYKSLNVPMSRMESDSSFNLGRASEITRDEVKFNKFINSLRVTFSDIFWQILKQQLLLKKIINPDDFTKIQSKSRIIFTNDTYFTELKKSEILRERVSLVNELTEFVGVYFSHDYIQKEVLMQTDKEIDAIKQQIQKEKTQPEYSHLEDDEEDNNQGF